MAERLCGRWTRREATGEQGATQPPAKVPLQRRKEKDQSRQMSCLLSTEFMRNVSPTLIPERQRWKRHKNIAKGTTDPRIKFILAKYFLPQ